MAITLESINQVEVSTEDLMRYAQATSELPEDRREYMAMVAIAGVLYPDDREKGAAIVCRLEAMCTFLREVGAPGMMLPEPGGTILTEETVFAAAAVQPLVKRGDDVVFESAPFQLKVLELSKGEGQA